MRVSIRWRRHRRRRGRCARQSRTIARNPYARNPYAIARSASPASPTLYPYAIPYSEAYAYGVTDGPRSRSRKCGDLRNRRRRRCQSATSVELIAWRPVSARLRGILAGAAGRNLQRHVPTAPPPPPVARVCATAADRRREYHWY